MVCYTLNVTFSPYIIPLKMHQMYLFVEITEVQLWVKLADSCQLQLPLSAHLSIKAAIPLSLRFLGSLKDTNGTVTCFWILGLKRAALFWVAMTISGTAVFSNPASWFNCFATCTWKGLSWSHTVDRIVMTVGPISLVSIDGTVHGMGEVMTGLFIYLTPGGHRHCSFSYTVCSFLRFPLLREPIESYFYADPVSCCICIS